MITKVKCKDCRKLFIRKEDRKTNDEYMYKRSCFNKHYTPCSDCSALIETSDSETINIVKDCEKIVSDNCADNYSVCSSWSDYISNDEIQDCSHDDCYYCQSCFEEHSFTYTVNTVTYSNTAIMHHLRYIVIITLLFIKKS